MTDWLLDTNVLSELRRPKPDLNVQAFIAGRSLDQLYVSSVTFAEIRFGIEMVADASLRTQLNEWLTNKMRPMFDGRTLVVSENIMFKWRLLVEEGRKARHTFPQPDLIIAATALQHDLTVVTRNISDYVLTRVPVLNPWTDPPVAAPGGK